MSNETEFVGGLIAKAPHPKSPEYVKAKLSIKREELIAWLSDRDGEWINVEVKESRNGKWYCQVDQWKPDGERARQNQEPRHRSEAPTDDDLSDVPF